MPEYYVKVVNPNNFKIVLEEYTVANLQDLKGLMQDLHNDWNQMLLYDSNFELIGIY